MRIGILKTDSVRAEFQREFGDYPAMFRAMLMASADDVPIEFQDYDVQRGEYPASLDACDAYLITGSRESVYDDQPWIHRLAQFVRELDVARHPLVGICFGHQLVAHVLGGETRAADVGWAVGVHETVVVSPAEWMQPYRERFGLLSSHKDQVVRLPDRAAVFASTPLCPNSGFTIDDHILTFQGHPEFAKGYARALIELRRELLGEPRYTSGVASLDRPIHPSLIGRWIVNFVAAHATSRTTSVTPRVAGAKNCEGRPAIKRTSGLAGSQAHRTPVWRVLLLLALVWVSTGCGVKLAYNNLDRLARWSADDYFKLDAAQEAYFDAELDAVLYWHRTTELPVYARTLRQLDVALADGATVEEMFSFRQEVEGWWQRILEASLPLTTQLMYSASDAQLDRFATQFDKDTLKYIKPYEKLSVEERRERWVRELRENFETFTGRLNNEQRQRINQFSARWVPDDRSWAAYRHRYGEALVAQVRKRDGYVEFSRAFRELTFNRERFYGDDYASAIAANRDLYRDLSIEIVNSLTPDQHRELSKTLLDVAKDFDELAADAAPTAPPSACLIEC